MKVASDSYVIENINRLPNDFLSKLNSLLNDPKKLSYVLSVVERAGILFERENFQITFSCAEEVYAAKDLLNVKFGNK